MTTSKRDYNGDKILNTKVNAWMRQIDNPLSLTYTITKREIFILSYIAKDRKKIYIVYMIKKLEEPLQTNRKTIRIKRNTT